MLDQTHNKARMKYSYFFLKLSDLKKYFLPTQSIIQLFNLNMESESFNEGLSNPSPAIS